MKGYFKSLVNVKSKEEKELERLQLKAKPYFDFTNFLKVSGVKFYQEIDLNDGNGLQKFEIEPSMNQINEWIILFWKAEKFIKENK